MPSSRWRIAVVGWACGIAGCANAPPVQPPEVPASLKPPAAETPYLEALATGVQTYVCSLKADASAGWMFKAPEASLTAPSGQPLGRHYAGPTWESYDGSKVVGEVRATLPSPTPSAIPWLLLAAKSNAGAGTFGAARSIQRLVTVGGIAPKEPCTAANVDVVARVPYTATYYFYR